MNEQFNKASYRKLYLLLACISIAVVGVFLAMYYGFQDALWQSVNTLNSDFVKQVNSTASMAEGILQNFSAQIFNIHSVKKLRTYDSLSNADMIDGIRALNDFTASSSVIDSIYVYNGKQDYVYSTLSTGAVSDYAPLFRDQAAVEMIRSRTADQRLQPIRRHSAASSSSANQDMFSLLLFDLTINGEPSDNVLMLNISNQWFSELYFGKKLDEAAIIIDSRGELVAVSAGFDENDFPLVEKLSDRLLRGEQKGDFVWKGAGGSQKLCFFTSMENRDWFYVRLLPYEKYLTGLTQMQSSVYLLVVLAFIALIIGTVLIAVRLWMPFHYIRTSLSGIETAPDRKKNPVEQLNALISRSADSTRINDALLRMLRDSVLSGLMLGQENATGMIAEEYDMSIRDGEPLVPIFVSTNRLEHLMDFVRPRFPHSEAVSVPGDHTVLLMQPADTQAILALCREMVAAYPRWYVIIDQAVTGWNELAPSYERLLEAYQLRFLHEGQSVRVIAGMPALESSTVLAEQQSERIIEALRLGNDEAVKETYLTFLSLLKGKTYQSVEFSLTHLARSVLKLYYEMFPETLPPYKESRKEFVSQLARTERLSEIDRYFFARFEPITEKIRQDRRNRQGQLLNEVLRMIRDSYTDPGLNLQTLADHFSMSPAYLGRLFRQAHGMSVAEYITTLRMEEAKRLLAETDVKIKDFGPLIGVENIQYFFVQFKNATGMTPKQYRLQSRRGAQDGQPSI